MGRRRVFAKNVGFLTAAEIVVKAVLFFWTIFLARFLGANVFGQYNFVNSFIGLFSFLPDLGISLLLIREISQQKKRAPLYLGNALVLNFWLGCLTVLLIWLAASFFGQPLAIKRVLLVAAIVLGTTSLRTTIMVAFNAWEKMDLLAFSHCFNASFLVAGGIIGLVLGKNLFSLFLGILVGTVASGIGIWWLVIRRFVVPRLKFNPSLARHLVAEGLPLGLASFFSLAYLRVDRLILSSLIDYQAVGWYSAASVFCISAIQLFNAPLIVTAFPMLSRFFKEDLSKFKQLTRALILIVVFWSLPLMLGVRLFSPQLIHLIFGAEYQPTEMLLKNLILMVPFAAWSAVLYKVLIVIGRQATYFWISLFGSLLNVLANILFISVMGIGGAVAASVLTHFSLFLAYVYFTRRYLQS